MSAGALKEQLEDLQGVELEDLPGGMRLEDPARGVWCMG